MPKLFNDPGHAVTEMVEGLLAIYPDLARLSGQNVLIRADSDAVRDRQVALISGGGSGHEPAHAGYVGKGMLSAAIAGEVFTSPSANSVLSAIRATAGKQGALLIIKNYTGDRLNFGLAAEMARAEGTLVESIIVADDVALAMSGDHAGRRGLAGTVLVHKIAGAAAAEGKDLPQVASIAQAAAEQVATMGLAFSAPTAPGTDKPSFALYGNVELGLGIHGEPGVRRTSLKPADELVDELLENVRSGLRLHTGERVALLINNLGATTAMELAIVARRTLSKIRSSGVIVERLYAGTFMSSLDMEGISISVLRVDDERLRRLDAPVSAPGWANHVTAPPPLLEERTLELEENPPTNKGRTALSAAGQLRRKAVEAGCTALIEAELRLTEIDQAVGDGDLGRNLARAARALQEQFPLLPFDGSPALLKSIGFFLQKVLGGSSGPFYGVLFLRAGGTLEAESSYSLQNWAAAILEGCGAISDLGGAKPGDRTMLDALVPFAKSFADQAASGRALRESLMQALHAGQRGAEGTAHMVARKGRSSYLGERVRGWPDPGAVAAVIWLDAVISAILD